MYSFFVKFRPKQARSHQMCQVCVEPQSDTVPDEKGYFPSTHFFCTSCALRRGIVF